MSRREQLKRIAFICLILILVLLILISGLRILESTVLSKKTTKAVETVSKTIERNGISYYPRQDITTMLLMGIDEEGPVKDSGSYKNTGESDMLALVIFDETHKTMDIIHLNRDAMVDMEDLGIGGKSAGTVHQQLALSHTYGSGLEDSCEHTKDTVENLFHIDNLITYYVAMNMDAIPILNDAVGGVRVNVTEDFSQSENPNILMGETVLMGQNALDYVQIREGVDDQNNLSRMERQRKYMESFLSVFRKKASGNETFLLETFESIDPYVVTNLGTKTMASIYSQYSDYTLNEVVSLDGELIIGKGGYYEYHLDMDALDALILEMLYAPKK